MSFEKGIKETINCVLHFVKNVISCYYPMRKSVQLIRPHRLSTLFQTRIFRGFSQKWKMERETGVMPLQK